MAKVGEWITARGALVEHFELDGGGRPLYKVTWTTEDVSADTFVFGEGVQWHIHEQGVEMRGVADTHGLLLWEGSANYMEIDINVEWHDDMVYCRAASLDADGEPTKTLGAVHFVTAEIAEADILDEDLDTLIEIAEDRWLGSSDILAEVVARKRALSTAVSPE